MEWSDEGRSKSHNGCNTPVLTCSPQSNATSLKTPNLPQKQSNSYVTNNSSSNSINNNNNGANYPSQYDSSLLMTSHPAYNDVPSLQQQQQQQQQQNHHNQRKQQQFATPSSPLSPALLSPFSPPVFSGGELHHGDQTFPTTPPAYQSPEKRSCASVTNGLLQQQQQQQKRKTNGTGTLAGEDTKSKQNGDVDSLSSTAPTAVTTSSTTTTKTPTTTATSALAGVEAKMCAACERSISDRYLLFTADRYWHLDCLRCSSCNVALAEVGTTCFSRSGMTLCRSDYIRMFGSTGICTSCRQTIPANDYVMRTSQGSVYHVTCFCCVRCHRTLVPGDKYGLFHGNLLCENDYWVAMTTGQNNGMPYSDAQAPPPTSQQQQQHHHLPPHQHHHHHQQQQQQQPQQQFRGCPQPMMNGKGLAEDHRHHHHHHPHHPHHHQQQPPPQQQQQQQQHLNQMRFSHKVG